MCIQNFDWRALVGKTIDERVILEWISEKYRVSLKLLNCQTFLPLTCLPLWRGLFEYTLSFSFTHR
jgi:hypothetical protein